MISFIGNREHALERMLAKQAVKTVTNNHGGLVFDGRVGLPRQSYAQSQVIFTQPQFYSPLHTPQNWQIPQKRREIYQWCRHFYENEPVVAAAVDFYSTFPVHGFDTQCDNSVVKAYFDDFNKRLNIGYWVKQIAREYYMLGDVFPFLELNCKKCHGVGVTSSGEKCDHMGASFVRLVVLNPDWIDVQTSVLAGDPVITLLPDDELKKVVWHKQPKAIYDRLPNHTKQLILAGRPIPLMNECVSHLKYHPYPYGPYGTSLLRRLFKVLAYKDKLMTAQWIVAERLILPIRVVKVGDADRPAGPSDIADVQQQIAQVANDPNLTLVTHHAFDYEWIGTSGKVLQLTNEYELINKEILQGLMLNEALLSGEMAGYQSAAIGAEALIERMESFRNDLAQWIEEKIYKQVAKWMGFVDEEATKELQKNGEIAEPVYIYPTIKWDDLNLRDDSQQKQLWMQLHERQLMSGRTLVTKFGLDYDQEIERMRWESAIGNIGGQQQGMAGAAGGMGGMPMGGAGGMGGGMPGMDMGGMPGGAEMGGGMDMGMGMGGPMGAGGGGAPNPMGGTAGKIVPKSKQGKLNAPEEGEVMPQAPRLTSLEQTMYKTLVGMRLPFATFAQRNIGPFRADFAMPQLKLDIECDGEQWHKQPEAKAHDQRRDQMLANSGWTVIRFAERDLKENIEEVKKTISAYVYKLWQHALERQKSETKDLESRAASLEGIMLKCGTAVGDFLPVVEAPLGDISSGPTDQGQGNPLG